MKKYIIPLIGLLFLVASAYSQSKSNVKQSELRVDQLIDSLTQALHRYYVLPDQATAMGKYLQAGKLKGRYQKSTDVLGLANQLSGDLWSIHEDPHLHVLYEPTLVAPTALTTKELEVATKARLTAEQSNNFGFKKLEVLPGNMGYFAFNGFTDFSKESSAMLKGALTFVSNSKALIIDLRNNGGGSRIDPVASYFFKDKTHLFDLVNTVTGDTTKVITEPLSTDGLTLEIPVYILTSKTTASAAEAFTASMQALKRAVVIGDRSMGASHATQYFSLGQGFLAAIPIAKPLSTQNFKDWEGVGIIPDIQVSAKDALIKAQEVILSNSLSKATDEKERNRILWAKNILRIELNLPFKDAAYFSGAPQNFSGLNFFIKGKDLYCRNEQRGNAIFKLKVISDQLFLLDENVQVQFVGNAPGKYTALDMLWKDGNVTRVKRSR